MADHRTELPHAAPKIPLVDKVIDLALSVGGGTVTLMSGLLAAVLVMYSGYVLYDSFATERAASSNAWDLLQYKPEIFEDADEMLPSELKNINEDYRAWLTVYDTNIDYPVMQGKDDLYYASHDIYKNVSLTGAIYLAAGNSGDFSDSYNVIYGHHMDNGAMFGALDKMTGQETGLIVAPGNIYDVQFFAVVKTDAYEHQIYMVGNRKDDVLAFLRSGGEGGIGLGTEVVYFNEAVAEGAEKIVALSTCANATTNGRLVIFGKMIPRIVMKEVTVAKVWDDQDNRDGVRPEEITVVASDGTEITLTAEGNWSATISLPKFDDKGEIQYTWTEQEADDYILTGNVTEGDKTTLTNTHEILRTSRAVEKVWDDAEDQDGIRPAELRVALLANGEAVEVLTLNQENGWTAKVDELPVNADGKPIEYTWVEDQYAGYTLSAAENDTVTTLTNTHEILRTSRTIEKVWEDNNAARKRPEAITVTLTANGVPVRNENGQVITRTLNAGNNWRATVEDLPVNAGGVAINYRWTEEETPGYTQSGYVWRNTETGVVTTITNTYEPEIYHLTVYYRYLLTDETAAPMVEEEIPEGEEYDILSPEIEGFRATRIRVRDMMPGHDVIEYVYYIPEDTYIGDLETPMGLGRVNINVGDCLE